jgi:hypothetical protein
MTALLMNIAAALAAALLGFAAHRGGICTVKAAGEMLSTRRVRMLLSFLKTATWAFIVMIPFTWMDGGEALPPLLLPSLLGLAGGFLFGIGAAINGACAISTISRLGDGDTTMMLTIMAMAGGLAAGLQLNTAAYALTPTFAITDHRLLTILIWSAALGWALLELRHVSSATPAPGIRRALGGAFRTRAPWRLSTVAIVIGVGNALLCAHAGSWAYTGTLADGAVWLTAGGAPPALLNVSLMVALIGGAAASSLLSRRLRLRTPRKDAAIRSLVGGLLMGMGAAAVPGGNDALLLHGLPALSPHAPVTYACLFAGCVAGLLLIRRLGGGIASVRCDGDICRSA